MSSRSQVVAQLQEALRRCEGARRVHAGRRTSTGCEELDRLLPEGGLGRGTLVEWLASSSGSGALWLALTAAREACREYGPLVVIDGVGTFYPPAAALAGIEPRDLMVVHVGQARDESWALDQALRSAGVGAVLCSTRRLSQRAGRRLQLAAEASGALGLLVRPATVRDEPCWAEARLLIEPLPDGGTDFSPANISGSRRQTGRRRQHASHTLTLRGASQTLTLRRVSVELLRARGSLTEDIEGRRLELEIDDETGVVRVAGRLAAAAPRAEPPRKGSQQPAKQTRTGGPPRRARA